MPELKLALDIVAQIFVILGIPIALFRYIRTTRRDQRDREYITYHAVDEKYLEYQTICLRHLELDVFDIPNVEIRGWKPIELTPEQEKQELVILTMLLCIFERAYLMYSDKRTPLKIQQWDGWMEYMQGFCSRTNFINAWKVSGDSFDKGFQKFMVSEMRLPSRQDSMSRPVRR